MRRQSGEQAGNAANENTYDNTSQWHGKEWQHTEENLKKILWV